MTKVDKDTKTKRNPSKRLKSVVTRTFTINDCPLWLWNKFQIDINRYNNCYWAKLMDWQRKAEMYDYMTSTDYAPVQEALGVEEDGPKDKFGINTITGKQDYSPKVQDRLRSEKENDKGK